MRFVHAIGQVESATPGPEFPMGLWAQLLVIAAACHGG